MNEEREELLEHRLTEKVRERVEKDLKRRYWWLGLIALVFTSGTITLIVNSLLLDSRIKLETATSLQETISHRLTEAADQVAKFVNDAKRIEQAIEAGASTAGSTFSELSRRADTLASQLTLLHKLGT